jgi:hypothetical protein
MLNIPGHKGNVNQNNLEISPHFSQNGYQQEDKQKLFSIMLLYGYGIILFHSSVNVHFLWLL